MTTKLWNRRSLLQTLSVGAGSVAYMGSWNRQVRELSLVGNDVRAALGGPPKRFVVVFNINGLPGGGDYWSRWLVPKTGTDFDFGPISKPLEKHKQDLVFFDNLIFGAGNDWGDTHWTGCQAALTGALLVDPKTLQRRDDDWLKTRALTPSIDAYLGDKIGAVATPQWPSLIVNARGGNFSWVSIDKNGKVNPAYAEPYTIYQKMFASIPDGTKTSTPDPALLKRIMMRKSVLDSVAKDLGEFRKKLPAEDRSRADAQLDAVRQLETRLATGGTATSAGCAKPTAPVKLDVSASKTYPQLLRTTTDVVVGALACDLTRVVMLGWNLSQNQGASDFDPVNSAFGEHAQSHDHLDDFGRLKTWYMGEVAYMADRLKSIPEGDGTMLDNTVILFATEISFGHGHNRMPWYTVGGKNLGIDGGRLMKLPVIHKNDFQMRADAGYPHQKLFVSLVNAMGLPDKTFGIPELGNGPMDGFLRA